VHENKLQVKYFLIVPFLLAKILSNKMCLGPTCSGETCVTLFCAGQRTEPSRFRMHRQEGKQ